MSDYIVAIDLGTSHITGIVGEKKTNGKFAIVAYETVETDSCIHRGIIYDSDETTTHIENIIAKLEGNLKGAYIDKIYVGVGGQSLHTIDHTESLDIDEGVSVTDENIAALKEQCSKYKPDLKDVLCIAHTVYYLDGQKYAKPVGKLGSLLEAHYKLVVGRSSIRQRITKSIEAIPGKKLAGIIVSPLALADAILSPGDKELGCALVDFGAGVTSVSIYKEGDLQHLCIIPLGGELITRDILSLQLTKDVAEKLKKENGSAIPQNEDESQLIRIEMEGTVREVELNDLNIIIEGRTLEIVNNVHARICNVIEPKQLGAGIVLAGGGAELMDLPELLKDKCRVKVRITPLQKGLVEGSDEILGNPLCMMAISLLLKGTESCVTSDMEEEDENDGNPTDNEKGIEETKEEKKNEKPRKEPKVKKIKQGHGIKETIKNIFVTNLFEE